MTVVVPERERYIDVYRAVALVRVMIYHLAGWAWLSIAFPAMGVMFAVAGSLTARSLQRRPAFDVVAGRLRRLLPPLWLLGAVVVTGMIIVDGGSLGAVVGRWRELIHWIVPVADPPGDVAAGGGSWAENIVAPLWYVRAYLWFVLLSPLLMWAFRRWPVRTLLVPLVVVAAAGTGLVDLEALGAPGDAVRDFATYGACWLLGFAHRTGQLRRLPLAAAVAVAAAAMATGLWWALTHPSEDFGYDLNEIPLAQALWSLGVVLLLLRWAPPMGGVDRVPGLGRLVDFITARAVTLYLWHNPAIDLAWVLCERAGVSAVWAAGLVAAALTLLATMLFGWAEDLAARRPVRLLPGLLRRRAATRRPVGARAIGLVFGRVGLTALAAVVLASWVTAPAADRTPVASDRPWTVSAYLVPWDLDRGLASLPAAAGPLSAVSPVWYTPADDGALVRNDDSPVEPVAARVRALDLDVVPSISNFRSGEWDAELVRRLIGSPALRSAHVSAIAETARDQGWDGIDIDYEALEPADYAAFGVFLNDLAAALHADGRRLTVALPAGTAADRPELARLYRLAGAVVDEVRVMAYDYAWEGSGPGPIAPVDWVEDAVAHVVTYVPRERVVLGLAAHGYDWPDPGSGAEGGGQDLMYADAIAVAEEHGREVQWSNDAQTPWFSYADDDGQVRAVWFEDAPSLAAKLEVAAEQRLGGVFLWRVGGEDPTLWDVLDDAP
ncbi:acyltransferase family protein [Jiangella mangrovi]|uniref:Spore germination protein YaaH/peptidoglycan/LPS O-acetylase OafA/YrhL n=1 Tax=Jiangella mangrovi TaxID=1524084 RepID=A0A7W9GRB4_9ACTN|nr:acyltransferase family protein [Jiangella mangrovi]MBB5788326.1 spore germination protein YaaH/peptidoglycan/LPS O-acetylase OafA/YrhL [Jiangella mangrovi]